jgi:hypothetical protein
MQKKRTAERCSVQRGTKSNDWGGAQAACTILNLLPGSRRVRTIRAVATNSDDEVERHVGVDAACG